MNLTGLGLRLALYCTNWIPCTSAICHFPLLPKRLFYLQHCTHTCTYKGLAYSLERRVTRYLCYYGNHVPTARTDSQPCGSMLTPTMVRCNTTNNYSPIAGMLYGHFTKHAERKRKRERLTVGVMLQTGRCTASGSGSSLHNSKGVARDVFPGGEHPWCYNSPPRILATWRTHPCKSLTWLLILPSLHFVHTTVMMMECASAVCLELNDQANITKLCYSLHILQCHLLSASHLPSQLNYLRTPFMWGILNP